MTTPLITGIHHVTAIAGPAARHLRFYTDALGLRLVKRTVNFDDPFTWHLYYGDEVGSPGTLVTHFPHERATRARHGTEEIRETVLAAPPGELGAWVDRLGALGVEHATERVFGQERIAFADPDGMRLAIVEEAHPAGRSAGAAGGLAPEHAITGVAAVVIHTPVADETVDFLNGVLGFRTHETHADRVGLRLGEGRAGERLEVVDDADPQRARMSAGVVHHVAWRVPDDGTQRRAAEAIRAAGVQVTPVMDRLYFRSIYFRIPGGVIFEIATDGPGFDIDEPRESLGERLMLPPQYEPRRAEIESRLAPLGAV